MTDRRKYSDDCVMNSMVDDYERTLLKEALAKLKPENHRLFKLMYADPSVQGPARVPLAEEMDINDCVDQMESSKIPWAMRQVETTIKRNGVNND
jgi:hypothetical protein